MPGLVPGIHVFAVHKVKTWMAGSGPAMTNLIQRARLTRTYSAPSPPWPI